MEVPRVPSEQRECEPSFQEKIAFLQNPSNYPDHPAHVDSIETHISRVFLAGRCAYKLKKPVRYQSLDFTTLHARRHDCEEELRLNRRLAPEVYLGISTLSVGPDRRLRLDGQSPGQAGLETAPPARGADAAGTAAGTGIEAGPAPEIVVEYLVRMRRLPDGGTLDHAIRGGTLREQDVHAVATLLARFYARLTPVLLSPRHYWAQFQQEIDATRRVLSQSVFGLSQEKVTRVCGLQLDALHRLRDVIEARARDGKVIEGHGDLRPEHVWLGRSPAIIDCLEFRQDLRTLDPADDLGFLALECERLGAGYIHRALFDAYGALCRDVPPEDLVHFYKSFRAAIRAKLAALHLLEAQFAQSPKWIAQTHEYLDLAVYHVEAADSGSGSP